MKQGALTEAAIRSRVGERSFARGKRYYERDAIVNARIEGHTLRARCWGSAPRPYQLWLQLGGDGIIAADCSCPVGGGGYCKHVAALLLTWLHDPDRFAEGDPLEEALDRREKTDLIALIRRMIARYPDLEEMVDLYPAGSGRPSTSVNRDLIRRQVAHAFRYDDYEFQHYGAAAGIADELETIMQQADAYRERGAWKDAAAVYCTVLDELRAARADIYDDEGDLHSVFWLGSERLGECLPRIEQPEARLEILQTLVDVVLEDIDVGGYGFADLAYDVILEQATGAERSEIVSWVEERLEGMASLDDFGSQWRAEAFGRFLLELQRDVLTEEQFIQLCRRTGQWEKLVERLLQLGRVEEAIADARAASDYTLLSLANLFVADGHDQIAEELVWERAGTSDDWRLDDWLKKQAVAGGEWRKAMEYANNQFRRRPTLERYREIEEIAEKLGDWPERRERILSDLTKQEDYTLLTRIHLHEEDVEAALTTLGKVRYGRELAIEVAKAAEESHPREAIRLYRERVDRLIAARGRDNYARAAVYLTRVKKLYDELQEPARWQDYIGAIRKHKPRLPALLDELQKAGL